MIKASVHITINLSLAFALFIKNFKRNKRTSSKYIGMDCTCIFGPVNLSV